MHTDHGHADQVEKKPNYIPVIVVAVVLGFLAWTLLHNFAGKGNMWESSAVTASHEGTEGHEAMEGHEGSMEKKEGSVAMNPAELGMLDTLSGNFIYNTGAAEELTLPNGTKLSVGANSSEAKLVAFLSDAAMMVDSVDKTKGWISLDRLYFETGKSTLTPTSQTQLKNIAAILKAFPNVSLKLGGYTDNTGSEAGNLKLSDTRSKAALSSLTALGTASGRLAAEGYGQEHPIADNATPEGRAMNRRIDVRVTKK
ncbi:MAG: OmpA family protein [Chitinophagaceae bacterium]